MSYIKMNPITKTSLQLMFSIASLSGLKLDLKMRYMTMV